MELINNIFINSKTEVVSYFYPIKFKAPLFKRIGLKQELKVSGKKERGKYTNEHAVIFTVKIYHVKLRNEPELITLSYANESIPCRKITNDSYLKQTEYKLAGDSHYRKSREVVPFSILIFEVPTTKLIFYLEQNKLKLTLNFPKLEFKTTLKRQAKDHVEYVARFSSNKPIPKKLITKIKSDEKRQVIAYRLYVFGGIIIPFALIIITLIISDKYIDNRTISELILKSLVAWSIIYGLIHFLVIRKFVGSNESFFSRLINIFYS